MSHSPEPWKLEPSPNAYDGEQFCVDANGDAVIDECCGEGAYQNAPPEVSKADLERIVACVNFCAGIPTERLSAYIALPLNDVMYALDFGGPFCSRLRDAYNERCATMAQNSKNSTVEHLTQ